MSGPSPVLPVMQLPTEQRPRHTRMRGPAPHHYVGAGGRRQMRTLYKPAGLERQAVYWRSVLEGDRSTAPHTHDKTDEWVFVLAGRAIVHVGDARFEAGPNDFIGHPAGSDPHFMEAVTETTPGNGT